MSNPNKELTAELQTLMSHGRSATSSEALLKLLFDDDETIQFKERKNIHPADAIYIKASDANDFIKEVAGAWSEDGHRYCCNAVPSSFIERLDEIAKYEAVQQDTFNQVAANLRSELSLHSELFSYARTLFVEADYDAEGNPIDNVEARQKALAEILNTGLPFSFVTDTGGRTPHIGLVFKEKLSPEEFRQITKLILSRLPSWIDTGVGHINQLGRLPMTFRANKEGRKVEVKLLYVGERVSKRDVDEWITNSPILNSEILKESFQAREKIKYEMSHDEVVDSEEAAWRYISENNLKSAKRAIRNKIQVSCPKAENHKSGRDKNMSAVIWVEAGFVTCSACGGTVGRVFSPKSPLIPSSHKVINLDKIKVSKLF